MKKILFLILLLESTTATAQSADQRALARCSSGGAGFIAIDECLPEEHVGVLMLDAISRDRFFGEAGSTLASLCMDKNNGEYSPAWACASNAIDTAIRLGSRIPANTAIDDRLFHGLNRPELSNSLKAVEKASRALYPERSFWGGSMYRPLE